MPTLWCTKCGTRPQELQTVCRRCYEHQQQSQQQFTGRIEHLVDQLEHQHRTEMEQIIQKYRDQLNQSNATIQELLDTNQQQLEALRELRSQVEETNDRLDDVSEENQCLKSTLTKLQAAELQLQQQTQAQEEPIPPPPTLSWDTTAPLAAAPDLPTPLVPEVDVSSRSTSKKKVLPLPPKVKVPGGVTHTTKRPVSIASHHRPNNHPKFK